jgi:maleate isomerase
MYGWQASIGLICPKDNMVVEPEFYQLSTDGISAHSTRLHTPRLDEMPVAGKAEAEVLEEMGVDVVVYACNASSFHDGPEAHSQIRERLAADIDIPVTTASTAVVESLDALGATDVSVVTPYGEDDNERLRTFLEGNDVTPLSISGLGLAADELDDLAVVNEQTAVDTYDRVTDVDAQSADAVLVVSTNLASVETIDAMESTLGTPVVSVNQAMYWHSLRLAGLTPRQDGYGTLLS